MILILHKNKNLLEFRRSLFFFIIIDGSVDSHNFQTFFPRLWPNNDLNWTSWSLVCDFVINSLNNLSFYFNNLFQIATISWFKICSCLMIYLQEFRVFQKFFQSIWIDSLVSTSLNKLKIYHAISTKTECD